MTSETKTTIEPGDILTIEIECTACGYRAIRLVSVYRNDPYGCANCGAKWNHLSDEFRQLSQLVQLLGFFAGRQAANGLPYKLRFEIPEQKQKDRRESDY